MSETELAKSDSVWFTDDDISKISKVLRSGEICGYWGDIRGGPYLKEFESLMGRYLNAGHVLGVANGTSSILLALRAVGTRPGDRVLVSPYTHIGSVAPIRAAGALPVFVDIDAKDGNISPRTLRKALRETPKLRAVIVAHQLGYPCDLDEILEETSRLGIPVIEDASQAMGAEYDGKKIGTLGDMGCFSIGGNMTKLISTGEGGLVVTNRSDLADVCLNLRNHGDKYSKVGYLCYNLRLSELQAVVGLVQLDRIDQRLRWQTRNAKLLLEGIPECLTPWTPNGKANPSYTMVGCRFDGKRIGMGRDEFLHSLRSLPFRLGLPRRNVGPGYNSLVYQLPYYRRYANSCSRAERMLGDAVWFDYHRYPITGEQVGELCDALWRIRP